MKTIEMLRERRGLIVDIAARHGAMNVRIFGSVARGDETGKSYIDFLVAMEPDRNLYDLVGLQQDIENLLGRKADVITENSINRYLKERILREAVPL